MPPSLFPYFSDIRPPRVAGPFSPRLRPGRPVFQRGINKFFLSLSLALIALDFLRVNDRKPRPQERERRRIAASKRGEEKQSLICERESEGKGHMVRDQYSS